MVYNASAFEIVEIHVNFCQCTYRLLVSIRIGSTDGVKYMKKLFMVSLIVVASSLAQAKEPQDIVNTICAGCHTAGVAGAPKMGDKAAWEPRIAAGIDAMVASVKNGKGAMPPGMCAGCTDEEIKGAINILSK